MKTIITVSAAPGATNKRDELRMFYQLAPGQDPRDFSARFIYETDDDETTEEAFRALFERCKSEGAEASCNGDTEEMYEYAPDGFCDYYGGVIYRREEMNDDEWMRWLGGRLMSEAIDEIEDFRRSDGYSCDIAIEVMYTDFSPLRLMWDEDTQEIAIETDPDEDSGHYDYLDEVADLRKCYKREQACNIMLALYREVVRREFGCE